MAVANIQAESACSNLSTKIHELSLEFQSLNRRIASLSRALDDALDIAWHDDQRVEALERAIQFNEIIAETASQVASKGEQLELIGYSIGKVRN